MRITGLGSGALAALVFDACRLRLVSATLGVAPEDEAKYAGPSFHCNDGSGEALPLSVINDEFCHCADGSDEPGTGACAGQDQTLFFCSNEGSVSKQLYASRVGDGVCDCCDGSDEAAVAARSGMTTCSNTCAEHGRQEKEELERRAENIRQGVEKANEMRAKVVVERGHWRWELARLKKELPKLETRLDEVKRRAKAHHEAEKKAKKAKEAEQKAKDAESTENKESAESVKPSAISEEAAPTEPTEGKQPEKVHEPSDGSPDVKKETGGEEKVVSEYAKWMDGAEKTLSETEAATEEAKPVVSEYSKWMDGAEETLKVEKTDPPSEDEDLEAPLEDEDDLTTPSDNYNDDDEDDDLNTNSIRRPAYESDREESPQEQEAKKAVKNNKDRARQLERNLKAMDEEHLGFASLTDKTLSKQVSEHMYKFTFFSRASQADTSLGSWKGFTGPRTAEFTGGSSCWQGPERMLKVTFECGLEEEIQDVVEPSRCVYAATVLHPGACDPTELDSLKVENRVVGPRDEL